MASSLLKVGSAQSLAFVPTLRRMRLSLLIPPCNIIELDSEATVVQVIVRYPFVPPPKKSKTNKKEYPPITFLSYSWVHGEFESYSTSFLTYESITDFLG